MRVAILLLLVFASSVGCQPRRDASARERAPLTTAPSRVAFAGPGVRLSYPPAWTAVPSDDFVLRLVPAGAADDAASPSVSLDVPKLPPHIPGLIPLGSVVRGYVNDLKKNHPDVTVDE